MDLAKSLQWYERAAAQDYPQAMDTLGYLYQWGKIVDKDEVKAASWYQKSANLGYRVSQYNLGYCYEHGSGVEKDDKKAIEWYEHPTSLLPGTGTKKLPSRGTETLL